MPNTEATNRLFWTLQALLPPNPGGTSWHPISQEPLTQPELSSISVTVDPLCDWEYAWWENHEHADPDDPNCVYELVEGEMHLVQCCGEDEPTNLAPFVVQASDKPYLTIHDFVTDVHPILMGLRQNVLAVLGIWDCRPLPEETRLVVDCLVVSQLSITKEDEWIQAKRDRHRYPCLPPAGPLPLTSNGMPQLWSPQMEAEYDAYMSLN
ncbi:hypothetical protein B0T10DRAFT_501024 [Thelonectria olida]|uniref:Uncharacterized protein n=1 Tax=Thelonectria olida TaxID=1576542 RepID=A0A9P9AIJ0_9HYPO|nr:hypothetical protein B0T10DRAFT_501024 [Thelonectria olida]